MYYLFCVVLCIVCVYMCTELLPPGRYTIAVNKYIIACLDMPLWNLDVLFPLLDWTASICKPKLCIPLPLRNNIEYMSLVERVGEVKTSYLFIYSTKKKL